MSKSSYLLATTMAAACLLNPALAQNKAAMTKNAADFLVVSQGLSKSLEELTKRATTASPNDKEMLKLINNQVALVDATADGVVALGVLTAEIKDSSDLAKAKKHLASRCTALKSIADGSAKYVGSVASSIAAVATAAEANKARDLMAQMAAHPLCNAKG